MEQTLWESIKTLEPLHPRFVSVTYGAGGSTRERTHATVERIVKETALTPAAHLTCVGSNARRNRRRSPAPIGTRAFATSSRCAAIRPSRAVPYAPHPGGYANAAELVAGLKKVAPFEISVAAYPGNPSGFSERAKPTSTI